MPSKLQNPAFRTKLGRLFIGDTIDLLQNGNFKHRKHKVDLIFTSPPFPLNRKKSYGNLTGEKYVEWIGELGAILPDYLSPQGSIVIEMGNAWNKGSPTMSTLPLESLLAFKSAGNLHLCQEFILNNPARLPGPVEWVNKKRCRVKDSFTRLWWMSKTTTPVADNRNVLKEYSTKMKKLLRDGDYNSGHRPSQHKIGSDSFRKDHGGAIPSNVLTISNTSSNDSYLTKCRKLGIAPHPARMPPAAAEFFIRMLTNENDLVFDPFAGSATTAQVAEELGRRWWAIEVNRDYLENARARF